MPTALELTPEQWQPYIEAAQQRPAPPGLSQAEKQLREELLGLARQVASELKTRFMAKRVFVFGSLARTEWFRPDSDVDLAVEGLTAADFWAGWRLAEEIIKSRPVDFVEIETAKPSLRQAILQYGLEL